MKFAILSIIAAALGFLSGDAANASRCEPSVGHCFYYECKHAELKCHQEDYFMKFGARYCNAFDQQDELFSTAGRGVLEKIKSCLQSELEKEPNLTCENAMELAYGHHEYCYLKNGFCDMSFEDKWIILWTVFPELEKSGFRNVLLMVAARCMPEVEP